MRTLLALAVEAMFVVCVLSAILAMALAVLVASSLQVSRPAFDRKQETVP